MKKMVIKNTKTDKLTGNKKFAKRDTSYSSFWLYNKEADENSEHFKDSFVNFYNDKDLLSEFNPTIAKNIISFWSNPKDIIYDPFAGRTRALVSYAMDRAYVGCEVSPDVVNYMYNKFNELNLYDDENFNVDIINDDCVNINKEYPDTIFDFVFSCPPYWNLEKYQSVPGQLSDINKYNNFLIQLVKRLFIAVSKLKKDGYMAIVIGDFRKNNEYVTLHSDLIQMMKQNTSIKLHDIITIQNLPFSTAAYYFGSRKKHKYTSKCHEYLLIWKKK
jgi:DNA modification methylase